MIHPRRLKRNSSWLAPFMNEQLSTSSVPLTELKAVEQITEMPDRPEVWLLAHDLKLQQRLEQTWPADSSYRLRPFVSASQLRLYAPTHQPIAVILQWDDLRMTSAQLYLHLRYLYPLTPQIVLSADRARLPHMVTHGLHRAVMAAPHDRRSIARLHEQLNALAEPTYP